MPFDRPDIPFEPSRTLDVDARHCRYYTQHGAASWRPPCWQLCSGTLQRCSGALQHIAQRLRLCSGGGRGGGGKKGKDGEHEHAAAAHKQAGTAKRAGSSSGGGGREADAAAAEAADAAQAAEEGSASSARPSEMQAWRAEKTHRHHSLLGVPMISPGGFGVVLQVCVQCNMVL